MPRGVFIRHDGSVALQEPEILVKLPPPQRGMHFFVREITAFFKSEMAISTHAN
jgi:hypothetical protein